MSANHTPLPWRKCGGATPRFMAIHSDRGYIVYRGFADITEDQEHGEMIKAPDWEEQAANQEFIVRACNSHYELIQALEGAQRELYLIRSKDCDAVYDPTLRARIPDVLAKAKGEV